MPLLKRTSSDMFWWPVLTLKRGYNETDSVDRGGSQQGGDFINKVKQDDSDAITSSASAQTATPTLAGPYDAHSHSITASIVEASTEHVHKSVAPPTPAPLTTTLASPSLAANINTKPGPDTTADTSVFRKVPEASVPPALAAAAASMAATLSPAPSLIPVPPGAPLLSSAPDRTQTAPTDRPPSLPNSSHRDNGLSPEEITIIVALVVSFVVFLALLALGIRCAILRRRQHQARERARGVEEARRRSPAACLPPALKKPSASSLRAAAAVTSGGGSRYGEEHKEIYDDDDHAGFRIVIRPPPGYRTPQSGPTTPIDGPPPLGNWRPSPLTLHSPRTVGRAVSSEGGQHWSLDTEHGSVVSEPSQKVPLSRLSLGTSGNE
ncbi:hypothetical protein PG985_011727 [Apiospora marii]|uniref:Uncharacterized protein n=1 Tax=Apiospora marii TaxID=335849 RepID=A0ABR1R0G3_9PEZI